MGNMVKNNNINYIIYYICIYIYIYIYINIYTIIISLYTHISIALFYMITICVRLLLFIHVQDLDWDIYYAYFDNAYI